MQGKRIAKVLGIEMEIDKMIKEYESLTSDLLIWIEQVDIEIKYVLYIRNVKYVHLTPVIRLHIILQNSLPDNTN